MSPVTITRRRLAKIKRAFTTRRVPNRDLFAYSAENTTPLVGDVLLARVVEIGKHRRIEKPNGRRALLFPGDEILVTYGNRYAPDQYEAIISADLGLCDLVAAGGIASHEINRHDRMLPPTQIMPIGLVFDKSGRPVNVSNYRIRMEPAKPIRVIVVVGTAMNAGKTFTAASIIRSLKAGGYRVAGIKATGTGSGGDLWQMTDMGADVAIDFTDAGFASTYDAMDPAIEEAVHRLINHASNRTCDFAVVEIADGLGHRETLTLLKSQALQARCSGVVFAAYDSLGAAAGYEKIMELGYDVLAISGQVTRSPLAIRETAASVACNIWTPFEIQAGALLPSLTGVAESVEEVADGEVVTRIPRKNNRSVIDFEQRLRETLRVPHAHVGHAFDYPDDIEQAG